MRSTLKSPTFLIILALLIIYFVIRLINLTIIPIFVDEAIYTHWSQIIGSDLNQWAIPLSDGKQPLFMWLGAISLKIFSDPLFGERFVSVLSGSTTMLIIYFLVNEIFSKKAAFFSMLLYIFSPFSLMYDRLAVPDNLLTSFYILIILLILKLIKQPKLLNSLVLGLSIGGGMLTKSTAALAAFAVPSGLAIFKWGSNFANRLIKLCLFGAGSVLLGGVIYYVLKLSPLFYLIKQRTPDFIFTPAEVWKHPLDPFQFRIPEVTGWLFQYLSPPLFLLCVFGLIIIFFKKWREGIFLASFFLIPLLIEMEIAKGFTARYFIFVVPVFLCFGGIFLDLLLDLLKKWTFLVLAIILVPASLFDFYLLSNPEMAPIPIKEKSGYLEQWSAGYGIKEIAYLLAGYAKSNQPITVGTEGTQGYGTLPDGLQVYLRGINNITVSGMGQRADIYNVPPDLISDAKSHPAYLVVNTSRLHDNTNPHLKLIATYPKANGGDPLLFYQVTK